MGTIRSFEEIDAWQRARVLTKRVYEISRTGEFARDFALRNQIRRASVSIMSNIAEGFERGGTKEFIQFLSTAKGSAAEVRSQLFVALDQNYITKETFRELSDTSSEISRMLSGLMTYLRRTDLKGVKYKST
ncbi:MAG: four helix bundle protein [Bacteroidota bacterium]